VRSEVRGKEDGEKQLGTEEKEMLEGEGEGVRVGEEGGRVRKGAEGDGGAGKKKHGMSIGTQLVRSYRSQLEDVSWARRGVVATVSNGEAVPLVQQRIVDAGFDTVIITPLGADKVILHSGSVEEVMCIINRAKQFFDYFFSSYVRWDNDMVSF
jgi:hypothetical protein